MSWIIYQEKKNQAIDTHRLNIIMQKVLIESIQSESVEGLYFLSTSFLLFCICAPGFIKGSHWNEEAEQDHGL